MAIALIIGQDDKERLRRYEQTQSWYQALTKQIKDDKIYIWPDIPDYHAITFAVVWSQPEGVFQNFPNLGCISSTGAGVNHLIYDQTIPKKIPIVRVVDPKLSRDMAHYVIQAVLNHTRFYPRFKKSQNARIWDQKPPFNAIDQTTVGIMGIGQIGQFIAKALDAIGISVIGFSQSKKEIKGIRTYDQNSLDEFLKKSNILVATLPLTPQTEGIINTQLIQKLPQNAYIINIGRGSHLIDEDLISALDRGHLSGAKLDVFNSEPLCETHPFWQHPKIEITPHNAAISDPESAADCVFENYQRFKNNQPLQYLVDRIKGY